MSPLISIIIPVYNHLHTLNKCLESILNQTYYPLEVIIVNDGSTDGFERATAGIDDLFRISEINKTDSVNPYQTKEMIHIEYKIINQENRGASAARNRGFKDSKGDYVIFWDADTEGEPTMLEKMMKALESHPEASYAYSQFKFVWKEIKSQPFDAEKLKQINYIDTTSLIRRADFIEFDESLKRFQDWDLWLTMLEHGKIGIFIQEVLYKKTVGGREGMSNWLPSFVYQLPWRTKQVKKYEEAREIIIKKHHLN